MEHCPYWNPSWHAKAHQAESFRDLGQIALSVLKQFPAYMHGKIYQVCGPVSTGGFNNSRTNRQVLGSAVRLLREEGKHVFDQTHLEVHIARLWNAWLLEGNSGYCWPILHEGYRPLFESGLLGRLYFLKGWDGSVGSCWERAQGLAHKIDIQPYPPELYEEALRRLELAHH